MDQQPTPQPESSDVALSLLSFRWRGTNATLFTPTVDRDAIDQLIARFTHLFLDYQSDGSILDSTKRHIEATCNQDRQLERVVWSAAVLGMRDALVILSSEQTITNALSTMQQSVLTPLEDVYFKAFERAESPDGSPREELHHEVWIRNTEAHARAVNFWDDVSKTGPEVIERAITRWKQLVKGAVPEAVEDFVGRSAKTSAHIFAARANLERARLLEQLERDAEDATAIIDEFLTKRGGGS